MATIAIGLALGAGASQASAQLKGSDTCEPIVGDILKGAAASPRCGNYVFNMTYAGGGSGAGETAIIGGSQKVAPMSRPMIDANVSCSTHPNAMQMTFALDGLTVAAKSASSCAGTTANNDLGSAGTWQNTLKLLYFGVSGATTDCNSTARKNLAANYATLFPASCATGACDGKPIKHVYRRGDPSGTTDTFKNVVFNFGSTPAFCNGSEREDKDPVRRVAEQLDQVAEFDGTLGLVLPIYSPTYTASNDPAVVYNATVGEAFGGFGSAGNNGSPACASDRGGNPYATDPTTGVAFPQVNSPRCDCRYPVPNDFIGFNGMTGQEPDAQKFSWNVKFGAGCQGTKNATPRWGMLNGDDGTRDNTPASWKGRTVQNFPWPGLPAGITSTSAQTDGVQRCCRVGNPLTFRREDPRLMNLWVRDPSNGALLPGRVDPTPGFYRILSNDLGSSNVGAAAPSTVCQKLDATEQIGCLVEHSDCSVGFAGMAVTALNPGTQALLIEGVAPSITTVQNWADGVAPAYKFSRGLFISTLVGFANIGESGTAHNGTCNAFAGNGSTADAEYNLAKCVLFDSSMAGSAADEAGFVPLPGTGVPYGIPCAATPDTVPVASRTALNTNAFLCK